MKRQEIEEKLAALEAKLRATPEQDMDAIEALEDQIEELDNLLNPPLDDEEEDD